MMVVELARAGTIINPMPFVASQLIYFLKLTHDGTASSRAPNSSISPKSVLTRRSSDVNKFEATMPCPTAIALKGITILLTCSCGHLSLSGFGSGPSPPSARYRSRSRCTGTNSRC